MKKFTPVIFVLATSFSLSLLAKEPKIGTGENKLTKPENFMELQQILAANRENRILHIEEFNSFLPTTSSQGFKTAGLIQSGVVLKDRSLRAITDRMDSQRVLQKIEERENDKKKKEESK